MIGEMSHDTGHSQSRITLKIEGIYNLAFISSKVLR